jgi:membrane-associated phospholipid phosphatase
VSTREPLRGGITSYDPVMAGPSDERQTLEDAVARRVERRPGSPSARASGLRELALVDRAVYQAVAQTPTPHLDRTLHRLSDAANYSRLWMGLAAAMAVVGGRKGARAAAEGLLAIAVTSATVNLGIKPISHRQRPDRPDQASFPHRYVTMPGSTSFPSGHAASAFAFSYAVGRRLPALAVPVRVLASAVAYSRVHTGVHYPGDVVAGSVLGAGTAAMVAGFWDTVARRRTARR